MKEAYNAIEFESGNITLCPPGVSVFIPGDAIKTTHALDVTATEYAELITTPGITYATIENKIMVQPETPPSGSEPQEGII